MPNGKSTDMESNDRLLPHMGPLDFLTANRIRPMHIWQDTTGITLDKSEIYCIAQLWLSVIVSQIISILLIQKNTSKAPEKLEVHKEMFDRPNGTRMISYQTFTTKNANLSQWWDKSQDVLATHSRPLWE
jgi:hypothetical protein